MSDSKPAPKPAKRLKEVIERASESESANSDSSSEVLPWYILDSAANTGELKALLDRGYPAVAHISEFVTKFVTPYMDFFITTTSDEESNSDVNDTKHEISRSTVRVICYLYVKMKELARSRLYPGRAFKSDLWIVREGLWELRDYLSNHWDDAEDFFEGVFDGPLEDEEDDDYSKDEDAEARRSAKQYSAFVKYLTENGQGYLHTEFLGWMYDEVTDGRHPPMGGGYSLA